MTFEFRQRYDHHGLCSGIAHHRPQRRRRARQRQQSGFEGRGEPLAEVSRDAEQDVDHETAGKNAASGTPRTGTTSARSR